MELPEHRQLVISPLAACFNNVSATYKFYWLLSILQSVEKNEIDIPKRKLFAFMISNAWYTVNYFRVSFGKQDNLQKAIEVVKGSESLLIDEDRTHIFRKLSETKNPVTLYQLKYFDNQVPHWFLSPWFPGSGKAEIYSASQRFENGCLYALYKDHILINPAWVIYLQNNIRILKDFCYWNLSAFLQSKNPNVPGITSKLIRPAIRSSLVKQRSQFWDLVIREIGMLNCIYTGAKLTIGNYAIEHFIPYSFITHDLIWNLIPAYPSFNSSKSDKLPSMEKYFNPFFDLQRTAIRIIEEKHPRNKFLEDYLTIFSDLAEIGNLPIDISRAKFRERIQPLITIASNNGFEFLS